MFRQTDSDARATTTVGQATDSDRNTSNNAIVSEAAPEPAVAFAATPAEDDGNLQDGFTISRDST